MGDTNVGFPYTAFAEKKLNWKEKIKQYFVIRMRIGGK